MKPQVKIITAGNVTHAYRRVLDRWIAISVQEARNLVALGRAQEVTHA